METPSLRRPQIDGLRCFLFLGVFLFHCSLKRFWFGAYGVHFFFSLSGFLITIQLLEFSRESFWIALRRFYIRRFLRIVPVFSAVVVLAVAASSLPLWPWYLSYTFNFYFFEICTPMRFPAFLSYWPTSGVHFWSLCVEEQFYLIYPALFLRCPARKRWTFVLASLVVSIAIRNFFSEYFADRYYGLLVPVCFEYMAWGAAAALVLANRPPSPVSASKSLSAPIALAALVALAAFPRPELPVFALQFQPGNWQSVRGLCFALFLFGVWNGDGAAIAKFLSFKPFVYLGRRSFALYLVHPFLWPAFDFVRDHAGVGERSRAPLIFLASLALAEILYWSVEFPASNAKEKYARVFSPPSPVAA